MTAVALWLNVFVRQARHIGMATIAQSVNVIAPPMTNEHGVIKQTTYWPLLLFSTYMRGQSVAVHVRSPVYKARTTPEWLASTMDVPLLDVSAALSDDGYLNLAVVNVLESESKETSLPAIEGPVEVFCVGGNENDIRDTNTWGSQKVGVKESTWNGQGKFTFEKHSFTLLRWKVNHSRSKIEDLGVSVEGTSATMLNALHAALSD
jgi:alpha-N-arabinofuranosidase